MRPFLHPVPIACVLIAVVGAVTSNIPMVALGLLAAVAALGFISARATQAQQSASGLDSLSSEGRTLLKPARDLAADIEKTLADHKDSPTIQVIGSEASIESQSLLKQVGDSLVSRDQLKRSLRGRYEAEKEIGNARMRLEFAQPDEKQSLTATIEARTQELMHYDEIEARVKRIDLGVKQAEAVLAEMRAKLAMSASADEVATTPNDDVRETIGRLKSLSASFEEANQVVRGS